MDELRNNKFYEFCDRVEGSSLEDMSIDLWGSEAFGENDPKMKLAPVAERIVNPAATQWAWMQEFKDNTQSYRWFYDRLQDQTSKDTLMSVLRYRLSWDGDDLDQALPGPQYKYFDWDLLNRPERAVYVDGGAYTGGSVVNFVNKYGGDYKSIYGFEPFPESFDKLQQKCGDYERTELIQKGLWDSASHLIISGENQSATIMSPDNTASDSDIAIETVTLDSYMDELPSFIKMDMEGSEIKAISGAERCIQSGMPALAICVYHLLDDLRTIPEKIIGISDAYDLSLRNYKKHGSAEIVLYANPQHR